MRKVKGGKYAGRSGWKDKDGRIWVPTNGKAEDGGPLWDVQEDEDGGRYGNAFPGGRWVYK